MGRVVSTGTKIKQCEALQVADIGQVAHRFIANMVLRTDGGKDTTMLTGPQVTWIDDLWERHFA